jgi:hypothetical protein
LKKPIAYSLVFLILTACAQIKPPTGGPIDKDPPILVGATPNNFSTNYTSNSFVLEFNEFVQLKNISQQLVINPPMKERPEFRIKGKKVIVNIKSELTENTTYLFNFGDAIVDITEGNKASGLQYVFSTGSYLDSLMVSGSVLNAFDRKPEPNVLVMLYRNPSDTMPYKAMPDYFGKTDNQGKFEINFIGSGNYRAFALRDDNGNYLYNPPTESMGFLKETIPAGLADSTNLPIVLNLFNEVDSTQFIDSKKLYYYGEMQLVFKQPADSVVLRPLNQEIALITETGVVGDTVFAWISNKALLTELQETQIEVQAFPSFIDTLNWKFTKLRSDALPELEIQDNLLYNFDKYQPMRFTFNHPIVEVKTNQIQLFEDTIPVEFDWHESESSRKFELHYPWKEGTAYRVFFRDSTFYDIFNLTNDTLDVKVQTREERYYGNFALNLSFEGQPPFILEMMDEKGNLIYTSMPKKSGVISFEKMLPGNYSLRVIVDENENGKWDTGNFLEKKQPEKVLIFDNAVQIRSNWDLELSWDLKID